MLPEGSSSSRLALGACLIAERSAGQRGLASYWARPGSEGEFPDAGAAWHSDVTWGCWFEQAHSSPGQAQLVI